MRKPRLLASSVLAGIAVAAGLTAVVAPAASAAPARQVYAQFFPGAQSVTEAQCESTGTTLESRGRFDFFNCTFTTNGPAGAGTMLAGYRITG